MVLLVSACLLGLRCRYDGQSKRMDGLERLLALPGTRYYTGHCTGAYAYERLSAILGQRLRPLSGGAVVEI